MEPGTVIVCGLDDEGIRVVEELIETGVGVCVVDQQPDPHLLAALTARSIPCLRADPREAITLGEAGIDTALALICLGDDDLQALAVGLLAHDLQPDLRVVVHLRNEAVGRALEDAGVRVIDTARVSAPAIVESCLARVTRPMDIAGQRYDVVRATLDTAGTLRGRYGDLAPLALVSRDGSTQLAPGRDTDVEPGDDVFLIGRHAELRDAA